MDFDETRKADAKAAFEQQSNTNGKLEFRKASTYPDAGFLLALSSIEISGTTWFGMLIIPAETCTMHYLRSGKNTVSTTSKRYAVAVASFLKANIFTVASSGSQSDREAC
eukprot:5827410-Pleurochrysis_carterae.AAC.1